MTLGKYLYNTTGFNKNRQKTFLNSNPYKDSRVLLMMLNRKPDLQLYQVKLGDYGGSFVHGFYTQFLEYTTAKCLDGANAYIQFLGYLGICHSLHHTSKDYLLLPAQVTNTICIPITLFLEIITQDSAVIRYDITL